METQTSDETRLEEQFKGNQNLRCEFGGDLKAFIAFSKANAAGRTQIFQPRSCGSITAEEFRVEVQVEGLNRKLAANEAELKRLSGLKSAVENEASQYAAGVPCQV